MTSEKSEIPEDPEELKAQLVTARKAQAGSDSAYNKAATRVQELEAEVKRLSGLKFVEAEAIKRIDRIERVAAERETARELKYYAKVRALDLGVDYSLIDGMPFQDAQAVDAHLGKLANAVRMAADKETAARLSSGTKPQAGASGPPRVSAFLARVNDEAGRVRSGGF